MKSLKMKITLLVSVILIGTVALLTGYSIFSSNRLFVTPLMAVLNPLPAETQDSALLQPLPNSEQVPLTHTETGVPLKKLTLEPITLPDGTVAVDSISITTTAMRAQKAFGASQILWMIFFAGLGILATYFFVSKALLPLSVLNEAASAVDAHHLDTQLPLPSTADEVSTLTHSFNSMLQRLQEAFSVQKEFAQNAAHELKTPLAVIKTSLQVLELDERPTVEDYAENATIVKQSTESLIAIVEQLLVLTRGGDGGRAPVSMKSLILSCVEDLEKAIAAADLQVTLDLPPLVLSSDEVLLKSLCGNLLSNAVKYNRHGGSIHVTLRRTNGNCVLSLTDTGIGMSAEALAHACDPFYRADNSRSKDIAGNGLGLSIVQTLAEKLGCSLSLSSVLGEGTEATVTFPSDLLL